MLDALAGHSLITVDAVDPEPRFHMLAAVRELAGERLAASEDLADVEKRHAEHFGAFVANADWPAEGQAEGPSACAQTRRTFVSPSAGSSRRLTLPHMFRILWLFWQMRGRMPEGRAWIDEVQHKAEDLDDHAGAELLFTSAITAVEVGDDETALAAVDGLDGLGQQLIDPYLESAAQLAISWILPIVDDFDGRFVPRPGRWTGSVHRTIRSGSSPR